ncbi:C6 zinc cluster transcription factor-like protein [Saitoella coloradoensis]
MLERILVTRHGFRSNWDTEWLPEMSPTGIPADPSLSLHGVDQSKELATYLTSLPYTIDRIYASPFYRCVQTIDPTAELLSLPIYTDNGIGEWYGLTRATHPSPAPASVMKGFFPRVVEGYTPSLVPSTTGESMADVHERCRNALDVLIERADAEGLKTILICSHAATLIAIGRGLTGKPDLHVNAATCSISEYIRGEGAERVGNWKIVRNGDCSHLSHGEERNWWFEGDIPVYMNDPAMAEVVLPANASEVESNADPSATEGKEKDESKL